MVAVASLRWGLPVGPSGLSSRMLHLILLPFSIEHLLRKSAALAPQ